MEGFLSRFSMIKPFQRDMFSDSIPAWSKMNILTEDFKKLLSFISNDSEITFVDSSGGLEINSSNFKIHFTESSFLLKKWAKTSSRNFLEEILNLMIWLSNQGLPVPQPLLFNNGSYLIEFNGFYWSYFEFIEGVYYSGNKKELLNAGETSAKLAQKLSSLPRHLYPSLGPKYFSEGDFHIIKKMTDYRSEWDKIFGNYADYINDCWDDLLAEWNKLSKINLIAGQIIPSHFDLHPHNLLVNNSKVVGILDFESCKTMPVAYALAFNALKQCRQSVALNMDFSDPKEVGITYLKVLQNNYSDIEPLFSQFGDFAITEVLRRLCLIFSLNLERDDKKWNKVIPIQLAHLIEARLLFG